MVIPLVAFLKTTATEPAAAQAPAALRNRAQSPAMQLGNFGKMRKEQESAAVINLGREDTARI
jgi:hypothetical protein